MGKRRVLFASAAVVVGAIGAGGIATAHGHDEDRFTVRMRSTEEVPVISDTDGRGTARVELDATKGQVCFSINFSRIGTPNKGHIHTGPRGVAGPILITLFDVSTLPNDERNDALEKGRLARCVSANPADITAVINNPSGFYVNLHNARFPAGTLRGQLS